MLRHYVHPAFAGCLDPKSFELTAANFRLQDLQGTGDSYASMLWQCRHVGAFEVPKSDNLASKFLFIWRSMPSPSVNHLRGAPHLPLQPVRLCSLNITIRLISSTSGSQRNPEIFDNSGWLREQTEMEGLRFRLSVLDTLSINSSRSVYALV